jgi:ubiquitin C-terminal hydrolase
MHKTLSVNNKGVVGIQNMGNTCYASSVIQLLRACDKWNVFCLTHTFNNDNENDRDRKIFLALQDIMKAMWSAYLPAYVRPVGFMNEISKAVNGTPYHMFSRSMQNDSHEYLLYLLDQCHEELKCDVVSEVFTVRDDDEPHIKMRKMANNGWNRAMKPSDVARLFYGMMRKTIECSNCKNCTYQWEVFNILKIPCEGTSFDEWINKEVNEVTTISEYVCETCVGRHNAQMTSHIWKLPPCIFIAIRRFTGDRQKNMNVCSYDGSSISFEKYFAKEVDIASHVEYRLCGICDHNGGRIDGGHYTTQFRHPISKEWWVYDDEVAKPLTGPSISSANYIYLFSAVMPQHD